jgi:hypothetical protein
MMIEPEKSQSIILLPEKDSVSTQNAVESAMIEQAEIKKGIDQRGMGKIYVAKGAPCQVGCNISFLGSFKSSNSLSVREKSTMLDSLCSNWMHRDWSSS